MAVSTAELTLGEINQAIRKILLTGQSYSRAGLTLTRANLPELRALRKEIIRETNRKSDGISSVSDFSRAAGGSTESDEWGD